MDLLKSLKVRLGASDTGQDALLSEMLDAAKWAYAELRFPATSYTVDEDGAPVVEPRYSGWVISAAVELYNKLGAEGQTGHNENGVNRTYESADLSASLRSRITPVVGVVRG